MTDPLIDRGMIEGAIDEALGQPEEWMARAAADAVLDYLWSVLTPEALEGVGTPHVLCDGRYMYRRIFGDT